MTNKIIEIIIMVAFLSIILFSLKVALGVSVSPEPNYDKVLKNAKNHLEAQTQTQNNAIDHSINNTMQLCAITFDTGNNSKYSILCDKEMITLDKLCRDNYFTFCFGQAWVNYELPKHKNPPWCKSKTNSKGLDC